MYSTVLGYLVVLLEVHTRLLTLRQLLKGDTYFLTVGTVHNERLDSRYSA